MRLPWGNWGYIYKSFLSNIPFDVLGCLSFEERCCAIPEICKRNNSRSRIHLINVKDPKGSFPDFSIETEKKTDVNRIRLKRCASFIEIAGDLLASEGELIDIVNSFFISTGTETLIIDITALPKRYFGFFLRRILMRQDIRNVAVTYTQPGVKGYAKDQHLAFDPLPCDYLPGYAAPPPTKKCAIVVSIGIEPLNLRSVLEVLRPKGKDARVLMPFPPDGVLIRKVWNTLRFIAGRETRQISRKNIDFVSAWDAEAVFNKLLFWNDDSGSLILLPFGPKPHSLGMMLFALKNNSGIYYTQPRAYNPDYSEGIGETWAYVVKWDGVICYDRSSTNL
jgi:hypothetical protein